MNRALGVLLAVGVAGASCAAVLRPTDLRVLADSPSQSLFDDAVRWGRANHLETGGCFSVFSVAGKNVVVTDAVERVRWRRPLKVQLDCPERGGIWHTHYTSESDTTVGCNMSRALDRWTVGYDHTASIVICGTGRDSVILYTPVPPDSLLFSGGGGRSYTLPDTDHYDCAHESPASLARPTIHCAER